MQARALHFVFKIGNRKSTIEFCRNVLGMKALRHEEFEKGCDAACNGPYDGKWSKTMIGYGSEDNHFVIELTYNYGIKTYAMGNDFQGFTISSDQIKINADKFSYAYESVSDDVIKMISPSGYKFHVKDAKKDNDPVVKVGLSVSNLQKSIDYWNKLLGMELYEQNETSALLGYAKDQCALELVEVPDKIDRAEAFGRIAFSIPGKELKPLEQKMKDNSQTILTPYISLDTPGKATVEVVILADPDGHEICFVGGEGFRDLSQIDPAADELLNKAISENKSDEWFEKKRKRLAQQ